MLSHRILVLTKTSINLSASLRLIPFRITDENRVIETGHSLATAIITFGSIFLDLLLILQTLRFAVHINSDIVIKIAEILYVLAFFLFSTSQILCCWHGKLLTVFFKRCLQYFSEALGKYFHLCHIFYSKLVTVLTFGVNKLFLEKFSTRENNSLPIWQIQFQWIVGVTSIGVVAFCSAVFFFFLQNPDRIFFLSIPIASRGGSPFPIWMVLVGATVTVMILAIVCICAESLQIVIILPLFATDFLVSELG
jgi:hypothetical protein